MSASKMIQLCGLATGSAALSWQAQVQHHPGHDVGVDSSALVQVISTTQPRADDSDDFQYSVNRQTHNDVHAVYHFTIEYDDNIIINMRFSKWFQLATHMYTMVTAKADLTKAYNADLTKAYNALDKSRRERNWLSKQHRYVVSIMSHRQKLLTNFFHALYLAAGRGTVTRRVFGSQGITYKDPEAVFKTAINMLEKLVKMDLSRNELSS